MCCLHCSQAHDVLPACKLRWLQRQVAGTDDLESVQSIKLRVIGRETSLQRLCVYIPRLTELNLDGSSIGSLRELGCGLTGLRILRVTHCGLETLDGTFGLSALTELYAGYNRVEDIGYLACLPCIQLIDLRGNRVCDIRYAGFLTVCAFLRELVLADNPCAQQPRYRASMRELLPALHLLDGVPLGSYQQDDEESDSTPSERTSESGLEADGAGSAATTPASAPDPAPAGPDLPAPAAPAEATQIWADAESRAISRLPAASRPATASCSTPRRPPLLSPRVTASLSLCHWAGLPGLASLAQRPASAIEMGTADAPSALTSGKAVCGNLTLALRKARTRREAWGQSEQQPGNTSTSTSSTYSSSSSLSDRVEYALGTPGTPGKDGDSSHVDLPSDSRLPSSYSDEDGVLTASRRWRQAYQLYRDANREKWEHELDCRHETS